METPHSGSQASNAPQGPVCDFCGQEAPSVRRIALDSEYERLRTAHQERYACGPCSDRKERVRLGLERG